MENVRKHYQKLSTILLLVLVFLAGYIVGGITTSPSQAQDTQAIGDVEAAFSPLFEAYDLIRARYVDSNLIDTEVLVDGALTGMIEALGDPNSSYINPEDFDLFTSRLSGDVEGIGVVIFTNDDGNVEVQQVIRGTGAEAAGVQVGDVFMTVDGQSVEGMNQNDLALLVRGPEGTSVEIVFQRGEEQITLLITRSKFEAPNVDSEILEDSDVAYFSLSIFDDNSREQIDAALAELDPNSHAGLIFDLRNNGGGLRTEAVEVASAFIEEGAIIYEAEADGSETVYEATGAFANINVPIVVLINEYSASASELVAGAMQDYEVAYLIGEISFGKGTVQTLYQLSNEGALRVTIARYLLPSRRWIHDVGVTPDLVVELDETTFEQGNPDPQLQAAVDYILGQGQQ